MIHLVFMALIVYQNDLKNKRRLTFPLLVCLTALWQWRTYE